MENKYKEGEIVYARVNPSVALMIRRFVDEIYYCRVQDDPGQKEQVYFERELCPNQPVVSVAPVPKT